MISFSKPLEFSGDYLVVIVAGAFLLLFCSCSMRCTRRHADEQNMPVVEKYKAKVRSFKNFFEALLPVEFQYEPITALFKKQLAAKHDISILVSEHEAPRKLVILAKLLCILAVNVVLALLYYPLGKTCADMHTEHACRNTVTVYTIGTVCAWDKTSQLCDNAEANEVFAFVVFCALVTCVVTSFATQATTFLVSHAATAIKNRRLRWLYFCCVSDVNNNGGTSASTTQRSFRSVKVAPSTSNTDHTTTITTNSDPAMRNQPDTHTYSGTVNSIMSVIRAKPGSITAVNPNPSLNASPNTALRDTLTLQEQQAYMVHYGDEWTSLAVQSRKATILRAARYSIMKSHLDYTSVAQEMQYLLHHSRERYLWLDTHDKPHDGSNWFNSLWKAFRLRQLRTYYIGDPATCLELMHFAHLLHQPLIAHTLARCRTRATLLRSAVLQLPDAPYLHTRDAYLLQAFMVNCLCGYKRAIAQATVFEKQEIERAREHRVIWQYLALMLLPVYFIVTLCIVFYGGLAVTAAASIVWLKCTALSVAVHVLWQQPLYVWMLHAWMPGTAKKDMLAMHWVLQVRARSILSRRKGLLYSVNALVQHFNPACRVARLLPHLPVARLLLSLSDYDVPVAAVLRRPRRRSIVYPSAQVFNTGSPLVSDRCEYICINVYSRWRWLYNLCNRATMAVLRLLLHALYMLPCWSRQLVVEVGASISLLGLLLLLYATNAVSTDYTVLIVLVEAVAMCIAMYKVYRDWLREKQLLRRIEVQRVLYQLDCNPIQGTVPDDVRVKPVKQVVKPSKQDPKKQVKLPGGKVASQVLEESKVVEMV